MSDKSARELELETRQSNIASESVHDTMSKIGHAFMFGMAEKSTVHLIVACLASTGCKLAELYDKRITFYPFNTNLPHEAKSRKNGDDVVCFGNVENGQIDIGTRHQLLSYFPNIIIQCGSIINRQDRRVRSREKKARYEAIKITKPTLFLTANAVLQTVANIREHPQISEQDVIECMNSYFPSSCAMAKKNEQIKWRSTFLRRVYISAVTQLYIPLRKLFTGKTGDKSAFCHAIFVLPSIESALWYTMHADIQAEAWLISQENPVLQKLYTEWDTGYNFV